MRIKKKYRVLLIILACAVLLALGGVVYCHGEWWFPMLHAIGKDGALDIESVSLAGETRLWSLEELVADGRVTYSNNLMLVNNSHPLPSDFEAVLVEYNGAKMHPLMKDPYIALRDDVQAATGVRIYVASDYRTAEEQAEILAASPDGIAAALGCSEHEAGLALDVYAPYADGVHFLRSRAGRMVNRICGDYGYIIRYPYGGESSTGIAYEPWHLRYVGAPHAALMSESGLTLEEYFDALVPNTWYRSGTYRIARLSEEALVLPTDFSACTLSPDNLGYYVVTLSD